MKKNPKSVRVVIRGKKGAFSVIGEVSRALSAEGLRQEALAFQHRAFGLRNLDEVLRLASTTVTLM